MKNNISKIIIGFCAVFFCASNSFAQTSDSCAVWHDMANYIPRGDSVAAANGFAAAHKYIESCAKDSGSWRTFIAIGADIPYLSVTPLKTPFLDSLRDWLISVLYLNTNEPAYFCQCLFCIIHTYPSQKYNSQTDGNMPNAGLAVLNVLRTVKGCEGFGYDSLYVQSIRTRHQLWQESQQNGKTPPEDTAIPPLDSIGLGFLDPKNGVIQDASSSGIQSLTSFTSSPNPFQKETTLDFTLTRMSYIQLAIYDELGRLVWGDGRNSSFETGEHMVHIDGNSLPSGTLYARISTGFGEVKTIELIMEK